MSGALVLHDAGLARGSLDLRVDLRVEPGEVTVLIGPNGSGKTSLLRAIAGLTPLARGLIRLGDRVLDDPAARVFVAPRERPVALDFQDHRLFPHLSVLDNVAFPVRAAGWRRRDARGVALRRLEEDGLGDLVDRRPAQLSGGQAQRVALTRALATSPAVLLLDEPMSSLDAATRDHTRAMLARHLHAFDGPVLVVTHDPVDALLVGDRIVVLEHGTVTQDGSPTELTSRPRSAYVARLFGLNLLSGAVGDDGHTVVLDDGGRLTVADAQPRGGRVRVALRPTALTVQTAPPSHASPRNAWPARVTAVAVLGDHVRLSTTGPPDVVVEVTPGAVADLGLGAGTEVWIAAKATDIEAYEG